MADAGFFKGTSAEQDSRFANKQKKLLKQMKFPDNIDVKIDSSKINLDVMKPWIAKRLHELLGIEDDVVIEFVFNQLEDKNPDPKMMQINLTGFLGGSKARLFIGELWKFLTSAQASPDGIPAELVEMKKQELLRRQEDDRLREIRKREEDSYRQDVKPDIHKSDNRTNARHSMTLRSENGNNPGGYKSRTHHEDDRRRPSPKSHRTRDSHSPDTKPRHSDKKPTSENKNDHRHRHDKRNDSHKSSKSRSRTRSPVKSTRKTDVHARRSSSETSKTSHHEVDKSEKMKSKPRRRSSSTNSSKSPPRESAKSDVPTETKQDKLNEQVSKSSTSKNKRKSHTPSPPRSNKKEPVSKSMGNVEKVKSKRPSSKEVKKTKKQSKRHRFASSESSASSRSSSSSSSSSRSKSSTSSVSEVDKRKKQKKKPQSTRKDSSSRSRSRSTDRHRRSKRRKDDRKHKKHSSHNSKSSSSKKRESNETKRKSHRDRPDRSSKRLTDKDTYNEKKTRRSQQSSSDKEIPCLTTPPKKPRLESQIRVQTPPPSTRLPVENKSEREVVRTSATSTKPNRTERIVVLDDSRKDGADSFASRVSVTAKSSDDDTRLKTSDNNNNSSEDEIEIDLRERLLREKAIKSMRRRQLSNPNNTNTKPTTTNDRIVYDLH